MYRLYCRSSKATDCHTMHKNYVSKRDVQALLSTIESDGLPHNVYKLCVEKRCTGFTVDHRKRRTATQCIKIMCRKEMYRLCCRPSKATDCHTMYINYVSRRDVQALLSVIESDGLPHNVYKLCVQTLQRLTEQLLPQ